MSRIALLAMTLLTVALLAASQLQARPQTDAQPNRFTLESSSLEPSASATSDDRFRLSAQLQRQERPAVSESFGLRLEAKLVKDTSGTCVIPVLLFSDGFESGV